MPAPIKFVFLELTNHCNFDCTFCPSGVMRRTRQFMDPALAIRLIDEIASRHLASEPVQLHVMGEPFLHPKLFDILGHMRSKGVPVRLFTNGALLHAANRERLFQADVDELVVGVQTHSAETYRDHRRGRPDYETYVRQIRETIEAKFVSRARTRIELHFMNTKHFNEFRAGKGYAGTLLPLVDDTGKALEVVTEWKRFGREVSARHALGFEPLDLEGLQGVYRDDPLACVRGNHCEFLPGVILGFKEIGTFCDYLVSPIRFVERYSSDCRAPNEQFTVLADGACSLCCVDYDGQMSVGHVSSRSIEEVWTSPRVRELQRINADGLFPTALCRVCRAFQVVDDYAKKFPGREGEPYALDRGWYPLEHDGEAAYRWVGKRALLTVGAGPARIELTVRAGHPRLAAMHLTVSQGVHRRSRELASGGWETIALDLEPAGAAEREVVLESEEFWIPARDVEGSEDRRELSVMVRDVRVTDEADRRRRPVWRERFRLPGRTRNSRA